MRKNDEELVLMFDVVVVVSACYGNSCHNRTC